MAVKEAARRQLIGAPQIVMVNERRSRELNHQDCAKRIHVLANCQLPIANCWVSPSGANKVEERPFRAAKRKNQQ